MSRVWDAFLVTMAMEFGDKTFFLATVLAQKRHPLLVFLGAAAALGLMTLGGTAFGVILPHFLPPILTDVVAALVYFVLGVVMMYEAITVDGNESEYESAQEIARNKKSELHASTFLQTMMLIVAAEWGDRSQVSTVSLASSGDFFGVFTGAFSAHLLCSGIAVVFGSVVVRNFSERALLSMNAVLLLFFAFHSSLGLLPRHTEIFGSQ
eukprot:GEMP01044541.1.p1 GENE.GEMP01044541.1~~GEMP01044541.1.p1  ORF type:complete len:209 (+),score=36.88 GEMP01044541.1:118-744(+)